MVTFLGPLAAASAGAALMALGLPKANVAPFMPVGLALIFWAWFGLGTRAAFLVGWFSGVLYFAATFSWFGQTAGKLIAPFGVILVLLPALLEGLAFAVTGALVAIACRRADATLVPLAAAAAFAVMEWVRSSGPLALPFGNVAYTQAASPLAPLAAFIGSFGLTFAVCVVAAYAAYAVRAWSEPRVPAATLAAFLAVIACVAAAWAFWPARHAPVPALRVAAIQGNIPQDIKWTRAAFELANARYFALTRQAASQHPAIILWPETVVTTELNLEPPLLMRIASLAHEVHADLIVGAKQLTIAGEYNALYYFTADGVPAGVYRKRRLVPFVEQLPAPRIFGRLPVAALISRFGSGDTTGVRALAGLRVAPMICWESAFDGAAHEAVRDGAQAFVVATDDAWFGETAGPYQHAEIAQMRALETGSWVLRAAATGISGIVAPTGRYVQEAGMNQVAIVQGQIGSPARAPYALIGALPVGVALALLYLTLTLVRRT